MSESGKTPPPNDEDAKNKSSSKIAELAKKENVKMLDGNIPRFLSETNIFHHFVCICM